MRNLYSGSAYDQKSVLYLLLYVFLVFFLVGMALFAGRGLEVQGNLDKLTLYGIFILAGLLIICFDKLLLKKVDFTIIHNPEKGIVSSNVPFFANPINLGAMLFIFFAPFFYYFVIIQKTFFVSYTKYQVLQLSSIYLAGEPAVLGESLIVIILFGFATLLANSISRNKMAQYGILTLLSFPIAGLMTMYHLFRYGGNDTALVSVFIFFEMLCILLILFASIIVLIIPHLLNNFFGEMRALLSNDLTSIIIWSFYILVIILYGFYVYKNNFARRR